jgi:citrate lyase subunit beta / citryl-CoA lyase
LNKEHPELLLRSLLFVPGHVDRFFESAIKSSADVLVFDLEDSVPIEKKDEARKNLQNKFSLCKINFPIFVRTNEMASTFFEKDVVAMTLPQTNGFVLPKIKSPDDIIFFDNFLSRIETEKNLPIGTFAILPLIETTEAVLRVLDIAKSSKRILALIFGHEDFLLDLHAIHSTNFTNLLVPRMMISMAARATGCFAIDTPFLQIKDQEGCAKNICKSRELGFSGMLVLHPSQIEIANNGYIPSQQEIKEAKQILSLNNKAQKKGRSITFSEGRFIAPPLLKQAQCTLKTFETIKSRKINDSN